jgi:hypothetical protein
MLLTLTINMKLWFFSCLLETLVWVHTKSASLNSKGVQCLTTFLIDQFQFLYVGNKIKMFDWDLNFSSEANFRSVSKSKSDRVGNQLTLILFKSNRIRFSTRKLFSILGIMVLQVKFHFEYALSVSSCRNLICLALNHKKSRCAYLGKYLQDKA